MAAVCCLHSPCKLGWAGSVTGIVRYNDSYFIDARCAVPCGNGWQTLLYGHWLHYHEDGCLSAGAKWDDGRQQWDGANG